MRLSKRATELLAAALLVLSQSAMAAPPANWDGLSQVPAKGVDLLYLRPGADFSSYRAIMLDPTEVAFRKDWQRDINRSRPGNRISDVQVRRAIDEAQGKLSTIFDKRLREAGFEIASAPAENVLRVLVGVANVDVAAPEIRSAGRSKVYSDRAGHATLVIEVRDSLSGELLGRVVDHGLAGDHLATMRNSVTNWGDFGQLFDEWARISARGLKKLVASSPTHPQ